MLVIAFQDESHANIGWSEDVSIAELAALTADTVGFKGRLRYATDKPDGMPRKLLDVAMLHGIGWQPTIALRHGLADAYRWFIENAAAKFAA
jgi:GDP-L-fucose synthase